MVKSLIKEIIIILLLLLAVILALAVLFYEYIPNNKVVPKVSNYKTSESVDREIHAQIVEEKPAIQTYEIKQEDLSEYQKTNVYEKGKVNPFSSYTKPVENTEDNNNVTNTNTNTNTNSMNTNVTKGNSSSNTFYKNTGTK